MKAGIIVCFVCGDVRRRVVGVKTRMSRVSIVRFPGGEITQLVSFKTITLRKINNKKTQIEYNKMF